MGDAEVRLGPGTPIREVDTCIVGAGAAGLMTAIFARRYNARRSVLLLETAKRPGAKILVSGGGRCNVTNIRMEDADFNKTARPIVRRVLRAFSVADTVALFAALGVPLHEEEDGKLFPNTHRARDVLDALLGEVARVDAPIVAGCRVLEVHKRDRQFRIVTTAGELTASRVVLAAGGQSLPKSGSDGSGFAVARALGHTIVPTTPALVPLLLDEARSFHRELSGVSQPAEIAVWIDGAVSERIAGSMLWTHFGVSGPAVLDASRYWHRARVENKAVALTASFCPGRTFDEVDDWWTTSAAEHPKSSVQTALATLVPGSMAAALLAHISIDPATQLAQLRRDDRRRLTRALIEWPLPVAGSRGYTHAEATAGGVDVGEIDPATMESRVCRRLYLVGEILDVDGRIGGFNFQWAWSSAFVAGRALAA